MHRSFLPKLINKLYHPGNQLSRRRQQNQEKLFVEWGRQKLSLRRNDGLRWKEHIAETKADEQRITSHPLSARLRAGRMLRNVCFRTHVIPSANSNFDPARGFHSTTAPFCFEACAPTVRLEQSEKFLDLGTVTRPPSSIYARVNCSVIRDWCTRVQGHPRNLFRRTWNFGLSSLKPHTWPYHASVLWYTEANFSFQMQQRNFPRPYLRNDTMDFLF